MGKRGKKPSFEVPCPNKECDYYGQINIGNISAIRTYKTRNGDVRKFYCSSCETKFNNRDELLFPGIRTSKDRIIMAIDLAVMGYSIRTIASALSLNEKTISVWLKQASKKQYTINPILCRDLKIEGEALDEFWELVSEKRIREWKTKRLNVKPKGAFYLRGGKIFPELNHLFELKHLGWANYFLTSKKQH